MRGTVIMSRHKSVSDAPNPFVHELKLTFLDKLQVAIMSVTVAPIRLILVVLFLLMVWPLAALAVAFRSEEDKLKPVTGWRLLLRPVVLFLCRTVFFAGGFYWVTMKGKQASSKEAPILLVAPHSSFFDALPVVFLGLTSVVAKASTHQIMLFGNVKFLYRSCTPCWSLNLERESRAQQYSPCGDCASIPNREVSMSTNSDRSKSIAGLW